MGNALRCIRPQNSISDDLSTASPVQQTQNSPGQLHLRETLAPVQQTHKSPRQLQFVETASPLRHANNPPGRLHFGETAFPVQPQPRQLPSWETQFRELFGSLPDEWSITEVDVNGLPEKDQACLSGWREYRDKGKVSFQCSARHCRRTWPSLHGAVIFYYRFTTRGEVKFWCPGQKCNRCSAEHEEPVWPSVEIRRSLANLLVKVKENFYGGPRKVVDRSRLVGNMTSGHRSDLCHACKRGVCRLGDGPPVY